MADFAIQRVGADAGLVHRNLEARPSAHYFLRASLGINDLEEVMGKLRLGFGTLARRTSGKPSLAKTEVVQLYTHFRTSVGLFLQASLTTKSTHSPSFLTGRKGRAARHEPNIIPSQVASSTSSALTNPGKGD